METADTIILAEIRNDVKHLTETVREIKTDDLPAIYAQAVKTNGRVSALELWRARWEGTTAAVKWLPGLLTTLAGGTIGAVATYLLS